MVKTISFEDLERGSWGKLIFYIDQTAQYSHLNEDIEMAIESER